MESAMKNQALAPVRFGISDRTRRNLRVDRLISVVFGSMTALVLIPLFLVLICLVVRGWPALSWEFLVEVPRSGMKAGGIWSPLIGTIYLVVFSLLAAAPVGVLAGIYLNEYATDNWFTRMVNLAVVNLAGVPSVVHGLFGVGAFVVFAGLGKSILAASLTLAIMTLPVIIVATKEALGAVPRAFRAACWNLGASRWQTIRTVVLPHSIGGILTGVILQVCRTAGDTAPIIFTGVVFYKAVQSGALFPYAPTEQCMALSFHLLTISTQVPGVPEAIPFATAVVLVGLVLVMNSLAVMLRMWLRSRKKW